ncbi:ERI1 exoribonuclease 3 isoform X6 [Dermacentor albipictus]|uniref:ERI1 exoribonuclease 3 isoform X6 n=1 Tax=Dermacentor albipictus TaxID=60249 RepID=UPI0031FD437C
MRYRHRVSYKNCYRCLFLNHRVSHYIEKLYVSNHCERYLLPERQMSRLASPTYLSACATLPQQAFDYFLLLDFEATCSAEKGVPTPQEIIEFPVLKVNGRTFETEATFHTYVQPQAHPQLTAFCIELTGIVQDMVDGQPHLQQVLSQFDVWMREQGLLQARTVFVTFGDWDLQKMLPSQCAYLGIPVPPYMTQWINLKKAFSDCTGHWPKTQLDALHFCGLPHLGRHHSGIDDCRNLAQLVGWLASRGHRFA